MSNMNNIMMKLFMVILLMMFSMGAEADVKVLFGENGDDVFSGKGGTIEVSQEPDEKDETKVIVTLTVTPKKNYSISKDDIKVYAVLPASVRSTRGLEISNELTLDGKDPQNLSEKRDYTVTLDSKLNLWVRTATFTNLRKGGGATLTCYIANNGGYNQSTTTNNFYMVPAADPHQTNYNDAYYSANYNLAKGDPERPFITTYKTDCDNNSVWQIISTDDGHFYIKHWATGKYLIYEPPYSNLINRKSVHLQTTTSPGDNAKFDIITTGNEELDLDDLDLESLASKNYDIIPISLTSGNRYLNPAKDNANNYYGSGSDNNAGGLIGVWKETTGNSIWHLEETVLPPTFTVNADGTVEISSVTGTTVHYLTDGNNPTATDGEYDGAITPTNEISVIKAIAVRETDGKVSAVVTLPLQTYTYYIVNRSGDIAVKCELKQPVGKTLSSYLDIPAAIQSPYLDGETVLFYSFDEAYSSTDQLSDENQISKTPATDANIYVTYTTTGLSEKFLKLHGASAFNITVNSKCIYDDSGLTVEATDFSSTTTTKNHLWYFDGDDPYAVQIKNFDTGNLLQFDTTEPALSVATAPTNKFFIIMDGSTSGAGIANGQMELMAATGDATYYRIKNDGSLNIDNSTTTGDASLQVRAYPVSVSTRYHLIDKAGKLIEGNIESVSSELGLPDEWKSPLVSEYHYYSTPNQTGDTYAPSGTVTSPFDAPDIYVTYDVGNAIDITGGKNYMLKFSHGESFYQEDEHDKILSDEKEAIYPYNNGEFNLYVYGQVQWDNQLAKGASTRTRWLWKFVCSKDGTPQIGDNIDPYHVVIKSHHEQLIKAQKDDESEHKFIGHTYLHTYKPDGYASVVTGVSYENEEYHEYYGTVMPTSMVNGEPTEYMILGSSISSMRLKTFKPVDDGDGDPSNDVRYYVSSFEQYWKNNPTANELLDAGHENTVSGNGESMTSAQRTFLQNANDDLHKGAWHSYNIWAYSKPWEKRTDESTNKKLELGEHWFQTIDMDASVPKKGYGEFDAVEVSLEAQVILLDQHGWEIMHAPLSDTETLSKYNSPMVKKYYWYSTATKTTGYHKYTVSGTPSHESTSLDDIPNGATDFYVTYTVEDTYARNYQGAATEEAVVPSSYLVKQGGNYATFSGSGTTIGTVATKPSRESVTDNILWNLKPNFNIDHEMGYKYAGENGATDDAKTRTAAEDAYYDNGQNGFDPYNVQIQSKAYPLRYFTTNTTGSALDGGAWTGTSSTTVTLQNLGTKYTATGYDQTTLNITNATFMVVSDGNGNMRLMPRFDNSKVMQSFGTLAAPAVAASAGDQGTGTQTLYIELVADAKEIHSSDEIDDPNGNYLLAEDFSFASGFTSLGTSAAPFTGIIDGQMNTFEGLTKPLVAYANGAIIKNIMLKDVAISQSGNVGAICCNANGSTRIYNCGILPTSLDHPNDATRSTVASTDGHCGSLVGNLDGYARVINCFSYANVSASSNAGGLVGNNTTATMQGNDQTNFNNNVKTMVVNCMFYGDITGGTTKYPVYGGKAIVNNAKDKTNNYNYYCEEEASYDNDYTAITDYNYSWPVAKKYLTRFEVYRNILNTNRRLCTWWVNGTYNVAPTDDDVETVGIAKWVLDQSIAPYPILKEWGKYYSSFYLDPDQVWNPEKKTMVQRSSAKEWEGKDLGTINVTIQAGTNNSSANDVTIPITITDMDTLNCDYCAKKIQLPYYNEVFGDPNANTWAKKYGNNYHNNKVVTGWKITDVTNGTAGTFTGYASSDGSFTPDVVSETAWEDGFNFADRKCTNKDLYAKSGRVFAQGGYYYVPDEVTAITIEAYWGDAVYLVNNNRYMDRVNNGNNDFYVAGQLPEYVGGEDGQDGRPTQQVKTSLSDAVGALTIRPTKSVYDQAIVLVGNYQNYAFHDNILLKGSDYATKAKPFTIMSADFDFDNEPDYCFQGGMNKGSNIGRPYVHPIRFDFLMVPDITMAIRTSDKYWGMRIFCPQGHFEITETSYLYTTQFEYDERLGDDKYKKHEAPMILNGGENMQIVSSESNSNPKYVDATSYFIMGGKAYMKAFTPGTHVNRQNKTRHCVVNAIGGEFSEFYLSGKFRSDFYNNTDNPHAYLDGGWFGTVAGAGMESVGAQNEANGGNVTFKINHSRIKEFYGGGINAAKPVTGNISVTIDNSVVHKYCGGPKLGDMNNTKTIKTTATNTVFGQFFGGGNGGTNMLREYKYDQIQDQPGEGVTWASYWGSRGFSGFTPFKYETDKGYHAEFEFELLPQPNGTGQYVFRSYYHYAEFSKTTVAPVTNTITDCTFKGNFYGGGNLGAVGGNVTSTLQGHTVVKGSVFGAGFSASIPSIQVHDKNSVNYTYVDYAGFIHDGSLEYDPKNYTWIHDVPTEWNISNLGTGNGKTKTFQYPADSGNWYVYTPTDLTGLGTVSGNVTLTIKGTTEVGTLEGGVLKAGTGNVFGGGAQSAVTGNTIVKLLENANINGNVYGGGDQGVVQGTATVNLGTPPSNNNGSRGASGGSGEGTGEESGEGIGK